jgi:hypothetical protein
VWRLTVQGGALWLDTYRVCHSKGSTLITRVISSSIFLNTTMTIVFDRQISRLVLLKHTTI